MICPKCKAEYREGFYVCADCAMTLVEKDDLNRLPEEEAPLEMMDDVSAPVTIAGRELACLVCGGSLFVSYPSFMPIIDPTPFASKSMAKPTQNYICANCGYSHCFAVDQLTMKNLIYRQQSEETVTNYETSIARTDECPICFEKIAPVDRQCRNCGHLLVNQ
jgi:hypothetical protein